MDLLTQAKEGFQTVEATDEIRERALNYLETWLRDESFKDYRPQLEWIIAEKQWAGLLDRFYQILPFGTGGRRGAVGIGPNRMNRWTLGASVQGHCEYLKERFPGVNKLRVVLAYDVRQFEDQGNSYNPKLPNPVLHLSSKKLAQHAASIYVANGIHVAILPEDSSRYLATPELSFIIRVLEAHGGLNISASHNPPDDNGGKFYDERGGQPVPPDDQIMADLVDQVTTIKHLPWSDVVKSNRISFLDDSLHKGYIEVCCKQSLIPAPTPSEDFKIVFTPLHGVGGMTAMEVLKAQGFKVVPVKEQMEPDGQFPNVTKSPNPEVPESMDRAEKLALETGADLVLATDPDADRIGGMMPDRKGGWRIINGNEIASLLTHFKLTKLQQQGRMPGSPIVIRTEVTTSQITRIARHFKAQVVDNLLVGFKYVADVIWQLEQKGAYEDIRGTPEDFVVATEESNGALLTTKIRDKDAASAALLLAEMALEQKRRQRTLLDYLDEINEQFGYFRNLSKSVYLRGIEGRRLMISMLDLIRRAPFERIGGLKVTSYEDLQHPDGPMGVLKGATDRASRNVLVFRCERGTKVVLRPSGTEPKAKAYIEVCSDPRGKLSDDEWARICQEVDEREKIVLNDFLEQSLALIGLDPSAAC